MKLEVLIIVVWSIKSWAQMPERILFPDIDDFESECTLPDGAAGMCRNIKLCPSAFDSRERVKTCYFERSEQFVCCRDLPKEYETSRACSLYYPEMHNMVGGLPTKPNEFPYMVALGFETMLSDLYEYKCGGALIAPNFVLTAAHCARVGGASPSIVLPGGGGLNDYSLKKYEISDVLIHPGYSSTEAYNDIALLKLNTSITEFIPACVGENAILDNENTTAIGYGHTAFGGRSFDELLKAYLLIISNSICQKHYNNTAEVPRGLTDSQLCAQDRQYGRDTCQGDSGGPLILKEGRIPYVVGITSFGLGCATETPGVYTRVSKYLDWIEANVWPK
ncbi:venom protease-like [Eurosta solidaginis]|uniref:venom protease-like n=1 Tax=Eurosta solidaginis TaxID=178769 RepID=UPI003531673D